MMLSPNCDNIADELKQFPQWVLWREEPRKGDPEKMTKPPYQPNGRLAESNNPLTWSPFSLVKEAAPRFDGVGFVLAQDDPYAGLDFDNCRCPAFDNLDPEISGGLNMVLPQVADYVRRLDSYTELSPSGKGLHVFLKGRLPVDGKKKGGYEAYQSGRYLTVTGHVLPGLPQTIEPRQMEVDAFYKAVFGTPEKPPERERKPRTDAPLSDWKPMLEKSFLSVNGSGIKRLWEGDHSSYPSQSEGDMALCSHLAFWLDGDPGTIDTAFRESGLYRPDKWDKKHHADGRTYGQATIEKALEGCSSFYRDAHSQKGDAPPEAWAEPVPFNNYSNLPKFPIDALPGVCGSMVQALADSCQVDSGLPGSQMLAVLSAAIGSRIRINLDSHTEQGNQFLLSVIASGNRKSEVNSQLASPLHNYQRARQEAMTPVIRAAETKMRILEKRLEKLEKDAASKDDPKERDMLIKDCHEVQKEIAENPVPRKPVYLVDDITPERLGGLMSDNGERAAILSAEGGFFRIIAGLYSKSGAANIDLILKSHTGEAWSSDRVGREAKMMEHPVLTLGLMVQPDVLEEIGRNSEFRGRGLSARFLYSWCQSKAGFRTLQTSPVSATIRETYHRLIESLMAIEGKHDLRLSPDAQAVWNGFADDVEHILRPGAKLEHLVDWGSKLPGSVARISGLLHFAEHGPAGIGKPISPHSVINACMIGGYFIEHALASFGIMKEDARLTAARKILDYIKRNKPEKFKGRDVIRHTAFETMGEVNPGLIILTERGYILPVTRTPEKGIGRPESDSYSVNPKISQI